MHWPAQKFVWSVQSEAANRMASEDYQRSWSIWGTVARESSWIAFTVTWGRARASSATSTPSTILTCAPNFCRKGLIQRWGIRRRCNRGWRGRWIGGEKARKEIGKIVRKLRGKVAWGGDNDKHLLLLILLWNYNRIKGYDCCNWNFIIAFQLMSFARFCTPDL